MWQIIQIQCLHHMCRRAFRVFIKNTLMRHHSTILYRKTEVRRFKRYSSNSALKLRLWVLETTMYLLSRNRKDIAIIHEKITAIKTLWYRISVFCNIWHSWQWFWIILSLLWLYLWLTGYQCLFIWCYKISTWTEHIHVLNNSEGEEPGCNWIKVT